MMADESLDHMKVSLDAPQPLHAQIRDVLRQRVLDGVYAPHERLPSESALMKAFGVSRITIRNALKDLHAEGLIFSAQGKGTYVRKQKAVQNVQRLQGFEEAMSARGYRVSAELVGLGERTPPPAVAQAFGLAPGETVVEVKRVRHLNGEPISIDLSYFPRDVGARLFGRDLTHDIFTLLEDELNLSLGGADIAIEAGAADEDTARLLRIRKGEPVLHVERLTFDATGRPIDFEYLAYRGDKYQYQFHVDRRRPD